MLVSIITVLLVSLAVLWIWIAIHELAHLIAVKATVGCTSWELTLWPAYYVNAQGQRRLRLGCCRYLPKRNPTKFEDAMISIAPFIADLVAINFFALAPIIATSGIIWLTWAYVVFWGGGLIDFINGLRNSDPDSDIQQFAKVTGVPLLPIRIVCYINLTLIAIVTIVATKVTLLGG